MPKCHCLQDASPVSAAHDKVGYGCSAQLTSLLPAWRVRRLGSVGCLHFCSGTLRTCSMPGLSGFSSGRVSTCSGTSLQPARGMSSQWRSTVRARCSSVCFF